MFLMIGGTAALQISTVGGVVRSEKDRSTTNPEVVASKASEGDYEIACIGGSTTWGSASTPIDSSLMTGQGFTLIDNARVGNDRSSEIWIRKNNGQSTIKVTHKAWDVPWSVTTLDGSGLNLDYNKFKSSSKTSGGASPSVRPAVWGEIGNIPANSFTFACLFFDDEVELKNAGEGSIEFKVWDGIGDGDGLAAVFFQPGDTPPERFATVRYGGGGNEIATTVFNSGDLGTTPTPATNPTPSPDDGTRISVPDFGACDWGLQNANIVASCSTCAEYKDGRVEGGFVGENCVFVAAQSLCYPEKHAKNKGYNFDCTTTTPTAVCNPTSWIGYDSKVCGTCSALVNVRDNGGTCDAFCQKQGLGCTQAWDDTDDEQCSNGSDKLGCGHEFSPGGTSDGICECYNGYPKNEIELSGTNDNQAKGLQNCVGECDSDSQCADGLICFQRSNGESIPGCMGEGGGPAWDYCYNGQQSASMIAGNYTEGESGDDDGENDGITDSPSTGVRQSFSLCLLLPLLVSLHL